MAQLTVQKATLTGLAPTYAAADVAGDTFPNNGATALHVKNGGAAAITVTIDSATPCSYGFDHDIAVSVPAGAERIIGPLSQSRFGTTASAAYSAVTSVTVAAVSTTG
jgi:hypothetical protein